MNFVIGLSISTIWKPVKIIIDAPGLVEAILDMVVCYHGFPNLIVSTYTFLTKALMIIVDYAFVGAYVLEKRQ